MKRLLQLTLKGFILLLAAGCSGEDLIVKKISVREFDFEITVPSKGNGDNSDGLKEADKALEKRIEVFSGKKSELAKLNNERGLMQVSPEFGQLLREIMKYQSLTDQTWNPLNGRIRSLWDIESNHPDYPPPDELAKAIEECGLTLLTQPDSNSAQLTGAGQLYPGRFAVGWAMDGAAEAMIKAGVKSGMITSGLLTRCWGGPKPDNAWEATLASPENDSLHYNISLPPGGMIEISMYRHGFTLDGGRYLPVLHPESGTPLTEPFGATVTAPTCAAAAALVESALVLTRSEVFDGLLNRLQPDSVGFFIIYPSESLGYSAEASPLLSSRVKVEIPE